MAPGRALITGIRGQDGSYLAELLAAEGWEVVGMVRPGTAGHAVAVPGVRLLEADLRDPPAVAAAVRAAQAERVFHLAAPSYVPASWEEPAGTLVAIAAASAAVVAAAGELGARVLVAGSPEMFGDAGVTPQDERSPRRPLTPYGVAKLAAHEATRVMREQRGVHACSVIPYNHESPRRPERFVSRRVALGVAAIAAGRLETLTLGSLDARRDWSHARDVVRGMHLALAHDEPGDYVLASGIARTVRELAEAAFAVAGVPADRLRTEPETFRPPEPTVLVGDASRARAVLGWEPRISFEELVREMVEADLRAAGV